MVLRADAAFAKPELYEALEARHVKYAIRLPANDTLERNIREVLTPPVSRPSFKPGNAIAPLPEDYVKTGLARASSAAR